MSRGRIDRTTIGALVVAALNTTLLVAIGVRHTVGYDSFWHVFIARQDQWSEFWREIAANAHPPLYYLVLRAAIRVLGPSLLVYRLISIVAIAASTLLIARIVQRLTASPLVAVAAAAAFGLSFSALTLGLEVRAYALNLALMLGAFLLFLDWIAADATGLPARKRWMLTLAMSAAILTHYSAAFFLAGAASVIFVLALCHARWRRRFADELKHHGVTAVAIVAVPTAVLVWSHMTHADSWTGRIVHLPAFMFNPAAETAYRFLDRTTPRLVALFFPDTVLELPMWSIAVAIVVALLALAARAAFRGETAAVPMLLFSSMLVLNAVAAVMGRYPFGGALRHVSFLFPFLVIAVFVGLDSARRAVPPRWAAPRAWVGFAAVLIGVNVVSWVSAFRLSTAPMMATEMQTFRTSVGTPEALFVDQFNLIMVFAHYHDGTWRLHRSRPEGGLRQVWTVSRGSEHISVCRSSEWLVDPSKPSFYDDVAKCLTRSGAARVGLFRPQQPQVGAPPLGDLVATVVSLADQAGLSTDTLIVRGGDVFAGFRPLVPDRRVDILSATYGGNCGATIGNVTHVADASCAGRSDCTFRIKYQELGDPAPGCAKDFVAVWTCGAGEARRAAVPPEAGLGSTVRFTCTP